MHYYLYEIKNTVTNKIYIGVHETSDLNDGYMGSGKILIRAFKKYGKSKFIKTILEMFDNKQSMYAREVELVTHNFISRSDTYNIALGGSGGSMAANRKTFQGPHSDATKNKISARNLGRIVTQTEKEKRSQEYWVNRDKIKHTAHLTTLAKMPKSVAHKNHISNSLISRTGPLSSNFGLKREKIVCPHCGKIGATNTMSRWHFDNCKTSKVWP